MATDKVRLSKEKETMLITLYSRALHSRNANPVLRKCVYRMDELKKFAEAGKWELELPLTVRGVAITEQSFGNQDLKDAA